MVETTSFPTRDMPQGPDVAMLQRIEERVLWLAMRMVHEANHVRPNPEGGKIGGHQSSSASMVTLMTALYFHYLRAGDRVSVKPHASPVFHAIQYLLGQLPREYLLTLRAFGGLQAYPSRTKDPDPVDFSTGSVGLGAVAPAFAALAHRYAQSHFANVPDRRFIALLGDAELDEGNIWEAVMDDLFAQLGNVLWIIDLNRQSLDRVVPGIKAGRMKNIFADCGWQVLEAKYGQRLETLFAQPGGHRLRRRIDAMKNEEYQALIQRPGAEIREHIARIDGQTDSQLLDLLAPIRNADLPAVIGNLGGHDFEKLINVLDQVNETQPTVLFAYTIKGWRLPFAGSPLNHSMLLNQEQIDALRTELNVPTGDEWAAFEAKSAEQQFCATVAKRLWGKAEAKVNQVAATKLPDTLNPPTNRPVSTQQTFGSIMLSLSRAEEVAKRIVTVAPDVSTSTNLAGWVTKWGIYAPQEREPITGVDGTQAWSATPTGQHIELGISEMNLFMALGMFGLSAELFGEQLIPIGTVYDPFVCRGLDAFIYGLYSGSKFLIVGTPSGITLAPEGGAHQSTITSSIGTELPNLNFYEPCYAQELAWIVLEALRQCCDRKAGRATYLRLSTKAIDQAPFQAALARIGEQTLRKQVLAGGYRLVDWRASTAHDLRSRYLIQIATTGAMVPEALTAAAALHADGIAANVLHLTSPRQLYERWQGQVGGRRPGGAPRSQGSFDWLIPENERNAPLITVNDGASHALAWLGSAVGSTVVPLGVDTFGQSGTRQDLYAEHHINADSILDAAYAQLQAKNVL